MCKMYVQEPMSGYIYKETKCGLCVFDCTCSVLFLNNYFSLMGHVCERIPKTVLEAVYGINLPVPGEAEDPNRPPTAGELLSSYGCEICFPIFFNNV